MFQCSTVCNVSMIWQKGWQFLSIWHPVIMYKLCLSWKMFLKYSYFTVCNVSMFLQKGRQFLSTLASSNKELNVPVLGSISQIFSCNEVLP